MSKRRRFFIFLSSAGIMTFFLFFTLSVREDKPLDKYMEWLPNTRVISMILERKDAQRKVYPKKVDFTTQATQKIAQFDLTKLEVLHSLQEGDVEFFHDSTFARQKPKQYYVLVEINDKDYFTIAQVHQGYSEIVNFGKVD